MILVVDSGSTKSDWILIDKLQKKEVAKYHLKGLNPAILSEAELLSIIVNHSQLMAIKKRVTCVYFYGAGCGTEKPKSILKKALESVFNQAKIDVKEDSYAAVRAVISSENEAAIVCILGTGSNCSYFDGTQLEQRVSSLGYVIMDDAAGKYYGRQLIRDYYFNKMPETLKIAFKNNYNLDVDTIKSKLYKEPNPNAYLASFAEFAFKNKDSDYIRNMIKKGLREFSSNMILQYAEEIKTVPVHFVGSIAYFSKDEIFEIAEEFQFQVGQIIRRPIDRLVSFHLNQLN